MTLNMGKQQWSTQWFADTRLEGILIALISRCLSSILKKFYIKDCCPCCRCWWPHWTLVRQEAKVDWEKNTCDSAGVRIVKWVFSSWNLGFVHRLMKSRPCSVIVWAGLTEGGALGAVGHFSLEVPGSEAPLEAQRPQLQGLWAGCLPPELQSLGLGGQVQGLTGFLCRQTHTRAAEGSVGVVGVGRGRWGQLNTFRILHTDCRVLLGSALFLDVSLLIGHACQG